MKSIFRELYYGNVYGKDIVAQKKMDKSELALYEKLKALLSEEGNALFDEFLEMTAESQDEDMLQAYKRGMATGMLLAFEAFYEGEKL